MVPVLCATSVPGGTPAGMPALNCCRLSIAIISRVDAGDTARPSRMASNNVASPAAVVVLFWPALNAGVSSTLRLTSMPPAPRAVTVARILSMPSASISRLVVRLLLTVIIRSHASRSVRRCPMTLYVS